MAIAYLNIIGMALLVTLTVVDVVRTERERKARRAAALARRG
jgi:hypothetical protein